MGMATHRLATKTYANDTIQISAGASPLFLIEAAAPSVNIRFFGLMLPNAKPKKPV
jgi:hypothetical protein